MVGERGDKARAYVYLHLSVEPVVQQEVVCHSDPMRLHRVTLPIVVVSNVPCEIREGGELSHDLTLQGLDNVAEPLYNIPLQVVTI